MTHATISIHIAAANRPGSDGVLAESSLIKDRRSKKIGALPYKARMVLEAVNRCLCHPAASAAGPRDKIGVSLGTMFGSIDVAEQCLQAVHNGGFGEVTPSWYATGLPNATAAIVASVCDMRGPNLTVLGHQAGIEAIVMGCRQIVAGRASAMLAGGFDIASERYIAQLRETAQYPATTAIHPGVGLVLLSKCGAAGSNAAAIVGWSQGICGTETVEMDQCLQLIESAAKGKWPGGEAVIHIVYPGRKGLVDYLAATAPIYLIENIIEGGPPGRHALIVKGFGLSIVCLLIEKARV